MRFLQNSKIFKIHMMCMLLPIILFSFYSVFLLDFRYRECILSSNIIDIMLVFEITSQYFNLT